MEYQKIINLLNNASNQPSIWNKKLDWNKQSINRDIIPVLTLDLRI